MFDMFMKNRSMELELLDLGPSHYSAEEYLDCMIQLDRIGRYLGGDRGTLKAISKVKNPQSILDIGCGGGLFTIRLANKYPNADVVGCDISPQAIDYANKAVLVSKTRNIHFEIHTPELNYPNRSFDIVTSTLVCHHLRDVQLIDFLKRAYTIAKKRVIINDLHRHPLAYFGFKALSPLFFRNRLVQNDGPLSIKRSFRKKEWEYFLNAAGIALDKCHIQWHWAFRWIISINCE